jgi:hypothetical protein
MAANRDKVTKGDTPSKSYMQSDTITSSNKSDKARRL